LRSKRRALVLTCVISVLKYYKHPRTRTKLLDAVMRLDIDDEATEAAPESGCRPSDKQIAPTVTKRAWDDGKGSLPNKRVHQRAESATQHEMPLPSLPWYGFACQETLETMPYTAVQHLRTHVVSNHPHLNHMSALELLTTTESNKIGNEHYSLSSDMLSWNDQTHIQDPSVSVHATVDSDRFSCLPFPNFVTKSDSLLCHI
jgi:hypothetical protein